GHASERGARRGYASHGRTRRRGIALAGGQRTEHSRNPGEWGVRRHVTYLRSQRLSADRISDEHRVGLRHECHGNRPFADLAEGPAHREDGPRLALGAAQRDPAPMADRQLHVQHRGERSTWGNWYRQRIRELPARPGTELYDLFPAGPDPGTRAHSGVLHPG